MHQQLLISTMQHIILHKVISQLVITNCLLKNYNCQIGWTYRTVGVETIPMNLIRLNVLKHELSGRLENWLKFGILQLYLKTPKFTPYFILFFFVFKKLKFQMSITFLF